MRNSRCLVATGEKLGVNAAPIEHWLQLGRRELASGRADRAEALARAVLALQPERIEALVLLANAKLVLDDPDGAIPILDMLFARGFPNLERVLARALNRRGARRLRARELISAEQDLRRALALAPDLPEVWFNLALLEHHRGRRQEACLACREAVRLAPDDVEIRLLAAELEEDEEAARGHLAALPLTLEPSLHATALRLAARLAASSPLASALLEERIARDPATAEAQADLLALDGELAAARGLFESLAAARASANAFGLSAQLKAQLTLGAVPLDRSELARWRQEFAQGLDRLEEAFRRGQLGAHSLDELRFAPFFLAYHGEDDCNLLSRLGDLLSALAQPLTPRVRTTRQRKRPRLALISSFFRDCTVGHYFASWLEALRGAGLELSLIQLGPRRDPMSDRLAQSADHFLFHEDGLDALAERIAEAGFDLILYPELGMDERIFALAALRLAPVQLCAWGHPMTSGLPTIDGFISVASMEPDGAQRYYREHLATLPGIGTAYPQPPSPEPLDRSALGLPEQATLVFYPHSPFKIHPDDDELLAELAAAVPTLRFVLFAGERPSFRTRLEQRFARAFARHGMPIEGRLIWLPLLPRPRYLAVAKACDFLLDCLRWSGGNTTLDALSVGLPVLTTQGAFMRGRQSAAMLKLIEADALVAAERGALLALARRFAEESELRRCWRERLSASAAALYHRADFAPRLVQLIAGWLDGSPP